MNIYNKDEIEKQKMNQVMDGVLSRESDRKLFNLETKNRNKKS